MTRVARSNFDGIECKDFSKCLPGGRDRSGFTTSHNGCKANIKLHIQKNLDWGFDIVSWSMLFLHESWIRLKCFEITYQSADKLEYMYLLQIQKWTEKYLSNKIKLGSFVILKAKEPSVELLTVIDPNLGIVESSKKSSNLAPICCSINELFHKLDFG